MNLDTFSKNVKDIERGRINLIVKIDGIILDVMTDSHVGWEHEICVSNLEVLRYTNKDFRSIILTTDIYQVKCDKEYAGCNFLDTFKFAYTIFNPYHYDVIKVYNIEKRYVETLYKEIEILYDFLPSKVNIYRYQNDFDLGFVYT